MPLKEIGLEGPLALEYGRQRYIPRGLVFVRQTPLEFPRKVLPNRVRGFIAPERVHGIDLIHSTLPLNHSPNGLVCRFDDNVYKKRGTFTISGFGESNTGKLDIDLDHILSQFNSGKTNRRINLAFDERMYSSYGRYLFAEIRAYAPLSFIHDELWISIRLEYYEEIDEEPVPEKVILINQSQKTAIRVRT